MIFRPGDERCANMHQLKNGPFSLEEAFAEFSDPAKYKRFKEIEKHLLKHNVETLVLHNEVVKLSETLGKDLFALLRKGALYAEYKPERSRLDTGMTRIDRSAWTSQMSYDHIEQVIYHVGVESIDDILIYRSGDTHSISSNDKTSNPDFLRIGIDHYKRRIIMDHGVELTGAHFDLVAPLFAAFKRSIEQNFSPANWETVSPGKLIGPRSADHESVGKRVQRARQALTDQFARVGLHIESDEIIENVRGKGYRLNPNLSLSSAAVLEAVWRSSMSRADIHEVSDVDRRS